MAKPAETDTTDLEQKPGTSLTEADGNGASALPIDPVLEADHAPIDHSAAKFVLEPHGPARQDQEPPAYENLGELPAAYGTRSLFLTARDPHWLYAYWDLTSDQIREGESLAHDNQVFLQVYCDGQRVQQIRISPWSREWYLHVAGADTTYHAEIGYYCGDGGFEVITRSPAAHTPPDQISWKTEAKFVTIPFEFTFRRLADLIKAHQHEGEDLADTLARLQQEGFPFPFHVERPPHLSESDFQSLMTHIGTTIIRRQHGSGEIIDVLHQDLLNALSSGQWPSSPSGPFSPFGASFPPRLLP